MKFTKRGAGSSKLSYRKSAACVSHYVRIPNPQIERNVKCTHRSRRPHSMPHAPEKVVSRSPGARGHLDLPPPAIPS